MAKQKKASLQQIASNLESLESNNNHHINYDDLVRRAEKVKKIVKDVEESQVVTQDTLLMEFRV